MSSRFNACISRFYGVSPKPFWLYNALPGALRAVSSHAPFAFALKILAGKRCFSQKY